VVASNYSSGDEVDATVTTITRFGVFARLDEGIEGLIHISSIDMEPSTQTLETIFFPGKRIRVQILHIDPDRRRLGLGYIQN
jgi:small subunit ribosomal protein S1